ncbi:MAG: protein kinase, partial [Alphaproteobacteria bacterium]|nr:protein kinase [Alphaproteobacteria bacterium]
MDKVKADGLAQQLNGKPIEGWAIEELIDFGKSAAVFRASRNSDLAAVKIFDNELIERYGDNTQIARIERELSLVGVVHRHLVKIIGGGFDATTQNHYIVMEYLPSPNLSRCLNEIPNDKIAILIEQLASAAKFLEQRKLCHRDIKPSNIVVLEHYDRLVLLDFGVLRPIGASGLT